MNLNMDWRTSTALLAAVCLSGCVTVRSGEAPGEDVPAPTHAGFVVEFYQRVLIDGEVDAAGEYLREDYIQHNPRIPAGLEGFKTHFHKVGKQLEQMNATLSAEIEHVVAEGDLVAIFVSYHIQGAVSLEFKAADVFRIEDGLIAEHWDVVQGATMRDHMMLMQN